MSMQTQDHTQGLRERVADFKRDNPRSHARDVA